MHANLFASTQVEVCAGISMPLHAHVWSGGEARGGGLAAVDSEVVRTVERASDVATELGSGGVWLTGPGAGSTEVVAAVSQVLSRGVAQGLVQPA